MKILFLFAGPNGSGKSTAITQTLDAYPECVYINADYCARSDPHILEMPDGVERSIKAWEETERQFSEMLSSDVCFAWETVFSHHSRLAFMEHVKTAGYRIRLTYVMTKNPDINVARVRRRVLDGGHDVPEEKIRKRYERSVGFLPAMILVADEALVYDNSYDDCEPLLVFQKGLDDIGSPDCSMMNRELMDEEVYRWVLDRVIGPLEMKGIYCQRE
ncbi:AAA family ATPase [Methanorbis rubei]|uniref:UDP-N-acetylglucosamine kinase n=1 Tax=Methanorbis rubei TaxID=3028300 RepID=A0AAE4MG28_9EURY|nr:hypothetical protein [Methanocorpusculaceae archaeon Cs1]